MTGPTLDNNCRDEEVFFNGACEARSTYECDTQVLRAFPPSIDFGYVDIDNVSPVPLTLINVGECTLRIENANFENGCFTTEFGLAAPDGQVPLTPAFGNPNLGCTPGRPPTETCPTHSWQENVRFTSACESELEAQGFIQDTLTVALFEQPDLQVVIRIQSPRLTADSAEIDFGYVNSTSPPAKRTLVVRNAGAGSVPLTLEAPTIRPDDGTFAILNDLTTQQLDRGSSIEIQLEYRPEDEQTHTSTLTFTGFAPSQQTNDPINFTTTVMLQGSSEPPP